MWNPLLAPPHTTSRQGWTYGQHSTEQMTSVRRAADPVPQTSAPRKDDRPTASPFNARSPATLTHMQCNVGARGRASGTAPDVRGLLGDSGGVKAGVLLVGSGTKLRPQWGLSLR
uniref:Uncharacterized protein n=1 Tax=Eutreptiella gymnastica TaxID=73025 RepID=A0A7S4G3D3_9EUGL